MFEKPPTKKKIGITWNTQVASHRPEVSPIALVMEITPFLHQMIPMNQCPNTTAAMLAARRKSMNRSRSGGVSAATRSSSRSVLMRAATAPIQSVLSNVHASDPAGFETLCQGFDADARTYRHVHRSV